MYKSKFLIPIILIIGLCSIFTSGCSVWNKMGTTGQSAVVGAGAGGVLGTGIGALAGGGSGAWIGALIGTAVGAGSGALIGDKMSKQKKQLEEEFKRKEVNDIKIETVKDNNNLEAIKVTFANGILFATSSSALTGSSRASLTSLAGNLNQNPDTNIQIFGYTDNTGSQQLNQGLSLERANSVANYLMNSGIASNRISTKGMGEEYPIASNSTPEGRAQNRRVEIYIVAGSKMIEKANQQSSQN